FEAFSPAATTAKSAAPDAAKQESMAIKSRGFDEGDAAVSAAEDKTRTSPPRRLARKHGSCTSLERPPRNKSESGQSICRSSSSARANSGTTRGNSDDLFTVRVTRPHPS